MTQQLPDHLRPAGPRHPGAVDDARPWRTVLGVLRTLVALLLGVAAATSFAAALVLAVGAVQVISPERPARAVPVLLATPELRHDLAERWAAGLQDDLDVRFTSSERIELTDALDEVLASQEVHRELAELRPVGDRLAVDDVVATVADALRAEAPDRSPVVRQALLATADLGVAEPEERGSAQGPEDVEETLAGLRRVVLGAAGVMALPGLVAGAVAVAVARRRPLTAVLISSGALLLPVVLLAPGRDVVERLPDLLVVPAHLLAAIGTLAGPAVWWTLLVVAAVPPAVWWALRSLRRSQEDAAPTT